jgi:hypothetical protein
MASMPGYELTEPWLTEAGLPTKGVWDVVYYAGEGKGKNGCKPMPKLRRAMLQLVCVLGLTLRCVALRCVALLCFLILFVCWLLAWLAVCYFCLVVSFLIASWLFAWLVFWCDWVVVQLVGAGYLLRIDLTMYIIYHILCV